MRVPFTCVKPIAVEIDFNMSIWPEVPGRLFVFTRFLSLPLNGPPPTRYVGFRTIGTMSCSDEFKIFSRNEGAVRPTAICLPPAGRPPGERWGYPRCLVDAMAWW